MNKKEIKAKIVQQTYEEKKRLCNDCEHWQGHNDDDETISPCSILADAGCSFPEVFSFMGTCDLWE